MKINISEIIKADGASLAIDTQLKLEDFQLDAYNVQIQEPVSFKGSITNVNGVLMLKGVVEADYATECDRCLKELKHHLHVEVDEEYISAEKVGAEEAYLELYTYDGNYIMLDKAVKDNIILNLPVRQLCSDECKGFCSECGSNLNETTCQCDRQEIDPRLQDLNKFFNN